MNTQPILKSDEFIPYHSAARSFAVRVLQGLLRPCEAVTTDHLSPSRCEVAINDLMNGMYNGLSKVDAIKKLRLAFQTETIEFAANEIGNPGSAMQIALCEAGAKKEEFPNGVVVYAVSGKPLLGLMEAKNYVEFIIFLCQREGARNQLA